MRWYLCLLLLSLALPCNAKEQGFDRPIKSQTRKDGMSRLVDPPQEIKETCWAFPQRAVIWKEDPGLKGIEEILLREAPSPKDICSVNYSGTSKKISLEGGWPLGVVSSYLFVQDEALGHSAHLYAIDLADGRKVFSTTRDTAADLIAKKKDDKISIQFYQVLELPCVPSKDDPACWDKVKTANKIPADLRLVAPNCQAAFHQEPLSRKEPRALAVSAPILVTGLSPSVVDFLPGRARCEALP